MSSILFGDMLVPKYRVGRHLAFGYIGFYIRKPSNFGVKGRCDGHFRGLGCCNMGQFGVRGLGLRVWGLGFRVRGLGLRV